MKLYELHGYSKSSHDFENFDSIQVRDLMDTNLHNPKSVAKFYMLLFQRLNEFNEYVEAYTDLIDSIWDDRKKLAAKPYNITLSKPTGLNKPLKTVVDATKMINIISTRVLTSLAKNKISEDEENLTPEVANQIRKFRQDLTTTILNLIDLKDWLKSNPVRLSRWIKNPKLSKPVNMVEVSLPKELIKLVDALIKLRDNSIIIAGR